MNVKINREDNTVRYKDLYFGDAFIVNQSVFIKSDHIEDGGGYAVNLEDGEMNYFKGDCATTLVTADVNIH